jgi:hypothetical protein
MGRDRSNIQSSRAGQLQPTGGTHTRNFLRTRLRSAHVYTYIENVEWVVGGGLNSLERCYLQTISVSESTVE